MKNELTTSHTSKSRDKRGRDVLLFLCGTLLLVLPPLLGALARPEPLTLYLEFPPRTQHVEHPPFSWAVFVNMAVTGALACILLYGRRLLTKPRSNTVAAGFADDGNKEPRKAVARLPWWGWCGALLTAASWYAAWSRPAWLGILNRHTFTPLWFGFILLLDGAVHRRKGHSMLTRSPLGFASLFAVSAVMWWFFEYLNRFTQNWYYSAVRTYDALGYVLAATPAFATVLPAVFEMSELLGTAGWVQRYRQVRQIRLPISRLHPLSLGIGVAGLIAAAAFPAIFYPALWLAPLFILVPVLSWAGRPTPAARMAGGDWRCLIALSTGALLCGFCWEMWNFHSWPKWFYTIPYVEGLRLFEMPLLGYLGYLPFGIECFCAWQLACLLLPFNCLAQLQVCDGLGCTPDNTGLPPPHAATPDT